MVAKVMSFSFEGRIEAQRRGDEKGIKRRKDRNQHLTDLYNCIDNYYDFLIFDL